MAAKFKKPNEQTIPQMEADVLKFWKENKIFEKSVESRPESDRYVFYDGPPFISGLPHYGHLLGSIAKDVIPRYWTMKNKRVDRVWGWDAGGITVENKVQKELGIENRKDIENYGLEKFIEACYNYTSRISSEWEWYIDRIGRWVDMKNAYRTTDTKYMESVMWAFKKLYDKGLIYEGVRTSLYCTTCGTPVSNFEVAMDNSYKDVEDPAVTIKFPVTDDGKFKGVNILAWTTTPWTLPSNRALVVDKNSDYVLVESEGEKYIVAEARLEPVFAGREHKVLEKFKGSEIVGLTYEPPYIFYKAKEGEFKVYDFEGMANMEEGTGIVHSAPGYGEVDTEMGRYYNLTIMLTVTDDGSMTAGDAGENPFAGMFYKKADKYIMEDLQGRNRVFKSERITHRFPYHDRCNTNLIQRAQKSWFVNVKDMKPDLLKNNEDINWVPAHLKDGRFAKGIEQAPDWGISRSRFWATPMPVWESADGDRIVVSSVAEIEKFSGQKVKDLHRPYIDQIKFTFGGKEYKRIPEVLDSWFEAGSMPYAQLHYPYENEKKFEENFPGDYIVEYIGQVRAWFYVMHVLSTGLFDRASFKNVVSTGVLAGNDGRKMSKTYGNYTDPKQVIETIGGDALRLYLMASPLMVGENANLDDNELKNKSRGVLNPLWNSVVFFLIYAELNNFDAENSKIEKSMHILDQWINVRLDQFLHEFAKNVEAYMIPPAVRALEEFVDDLSNWYVRRSRDRISSGDLESLSTLYHVLLKFAKGAAPLIPFISETIYQQLTNANAKSSSKFSESVHLEMYPEYDLANVEASEKLFVDMKLARDLSSIGNSIRKQNQLPVRQPLAKMYVKGENLSLSNEILELVKDELNVKEIEFSENMPKGENWLNLKEGHIEAFLDSTISKELEIEGTARELIREIQKLRKDANVAWDARIKVEIPENELYNEAVEKFAEDIKSKTLVIEIKKGKEFRIT
jgi:isoleucyl-tRNA synthetase